MKTLSLIKSVAVALAVVSIATSAFALNLSRYMGADSSMTFSDLKARGFTSIGHRRKGGLNWHMFWDGGSNCIAINIANGVVTDVSLFPRSNCAGM